MRFLLLLFLCLCSASESLARPVSYPGGWTIMQRNNWERNRLHLHYSPTVQNSYGLVASHFREDDRTDLLLQWNRLLLRRNKPTSQANLYLKSGAGVALTDDKTQENFDLFLSGDWETRRLFTSYEVGGRYAGDFDSGSFHHKLRLGIAPYLADYGSIHSWLMIQFEHHPQEDDNEKKFLVTPLIRFFKGDFLAELGVNNREDILFNFIIRY